jgi:hypothetical protein
MIRMPDKRPKRPRDLNQWAKHMVDLASGAAHDPDPNESKNPAAVELVGGTVRPNALPVFRLIANSYLVGACTGRSAGFAPPAPF